MKRIITFLIVAAMCFALAACSNHEAQDIDKELHIRIMNEVESVYGLGLTYYFNDVPVLSTGMKHADGSKITDGSVEFALTMDDVPKDADLNKFGVKFMVAEETGVELSVCTMYFPARFGDTYNFKLINEDGCYAVWSELDGETHSGQQMNSREENAAEQETELQVLDLVGPWHLDKEKNDISAIESAWETFPGYGEWGASMEIRSNGQMSWYIGAVGGSGTYTVEGDVLHAELTDSMEQKEVIMDFLIVGKDAIKMTYSDTEIIWTYGNQEDIPANGE